MSSAESNLKEDFTPFDVTKVEKIEQTTAPSVPEQFAPKDETPFEVPEWYWESLAKDPILKQELDQLIDKKARGLVKTQMDTFQKDAEKKGYDEGMAKANAESEIKLKEMTDALNQKVEAERQAWREESSQKMTTLSDEIMAKKEALLRDHEARWAKALLHILQRFHVGRAQDLTYEIREWVDESMREFKVKGRLRIFVPRAEYPKYKDALTRESAAISNRWELSADDELKTGEIRCDSNEGGVFFSWETQEKELERVIGKVMTVESANAA